MKLRRIVGKNVKKSRSEYQLTQQTVDALAQISISCLRNIEHGNVNITVDILENLAYSLGTEPDLLLKNSEEETEFQQNLNRAKLKRKAFCLPF